MVKCTPQAFIFEHKNKYIYVWRIYILENLNLKLEITRNIIMYGRFLTE